MFAALKKQRCCDLRENREVSLVYFTFFNDLLFVLGFCYSLLTQEQQTKLLILFIFVIWFDDSS